MSRSWPAWLIVWVGLLAGLVAAAPDWDDVALDIEFQFLPDELPSRRGEEIFKRAFPDDTLASSVVLVVRRESGLDVDDETFVEEVLRPGLQQIADDEGGLARPETTPAPAPAPLIPTGEPIRSQREPARVTNGHSIIARMRSVGDPVTGPLLVSADQQATLVVAELTTEFLEHRNWSTIRKIEDMLGELRQQGRVPEGLDVALTGSAVVGRDTSLAQVEAAEKTEFWTVLLVIGLLVLIYRAPFLALIPLATVFCAVKVSLKLLAWLAGEHVIELFEGIQIFITVLVYGAGVDYCLFLTARYREELDRGKSVPEAVAGAIGKVGAALTASAATVICGIGMLAFADFAKFRQAGMAIPIGLMVVLLATLTLSPSLLRLVGRWAFWPRGSAAASGELAAVGRAMGRHNLFQNMWEKIGQGLLERPGLIWLASVAAMVPFAVVAVLYYRQLNYDFLSKLPSDAPSVMGTRMLEKHFPAGIAGPITVMVHNDSVDFADAASATLIDELTSNIRERANELGVVNIRSLSQPLGTTETARILAAERQEASLALQQTVQERAVLHYVSAAGELAGRLTRLELEVDSNPFAPETVAGLENIERAIRAALPAELRDSDLYTIGFTASIRDLKAVTTADQLRIEALVLASVLLILVLVLRRVVISIYLIVSVLFSFLAAMGVTIAVFWLLDPAGAIGLDWRVPIFLFTILIAVGEDYNIFLMTRVHEEQQRHGLVWGVTVALARTGGVISSCGFIMAGTFAAIMSGSLLSLKQLGFALAFGVLLDTFVVRPILVPAFLLMLHRGWFGPVSRWLESGGRISSPAARLPARGIR